MPIDVIAGSMDALYPEALTLILNHGHFCAPRGYRTREVLAARVTLTDARNCLLRNRVRGLNPRFAVAEWLWITAGRDDTKTIVRWNKDIAKFSDDGHRFDGAYGPRLMPQWRYLIDVLANEWDTRQAVATIWRPVPLASKDVPCTVALQFIKRFDVLHLIVTMRSSDAWLGLPYDMFNFSMILNAMAGLTKSMVGGLTMQLGSFHLYEPNWLDAGKIHDGISISARQPLLARMPPAGEVLDAAAFILDRKPGWDVDTCGITGESSNYLKILVQPTRVAAWEIVEQIHDRVTKTEAYVATDAQ